MPRACSIAPPAAKGSPAPKGRKTTAQGNVLGSRHPTNPSPEGAVQGWRIAKISDFAKTTSGGTPSRANPEFYTGNIPWIKSGDLNDGNVSEATEFITEEALKNSSAKLFPAGTLMIALYGATIGKLGILTIEAATNQAVCGIFVPKEVDTKFLFYYLLHKRPELVEQGAGGAQPNISQGIIRDIQVPLPPLPEQRRIVARIEELFSRLDAGLAALRQAKAQLQRYRQSVLAAAVTGQLTQAWREQHPDTESAEELLERILDQRREQWDGRGKYKEPEPITPETCEWSLCTPENWALVSMEILIEAPQYGTSKKCSYEIEGSSVLRIPNVINGFVDSADLKFAKFDDSEIANYSLRENDLLMVRSNGSLSIVGKTALVRSQDQNHLYAGYLIRLRPIASSVAGRFLSHALAAPPLRAQIESKAKSTSGVNNINAKEIQSLVLQLPPLAEQHQIVAEVEARTTAIDHLEAELDRQITRSNRLRQSTLATAFAGQL